MGLCNLLELLRKFLHVHVLVPSKLGDRRSRRGRADERATALHSSRQHISRVAQQSSSGAHFFWREPRIFFRGGPPSPPRAQIDSATYSRNSYLVQYHHHHHFFPLHLATSLTPLKIIDRWLLPPGAPHLSHPNRQPCCWWLFAIPDQDVAASTHFGGMVVRRRSCAPITRCGGCLWNAEFI